MINERDPRKDPRPGDVLQKGNLTRRIVGRSGSEITYDKPNGTRKDCWITTWQDWCNGAEVLHVA